MKTLAIRVEEELHSQLTLLAHLDGIPLADLLRQAIENHVATKRSAPDFAERAEAILADIDQEAANRRDAIKALFGPKSAAKAEPTEDTPRRGNSPRGKGR